ncbi:clathrin light chain-like isoform X2 [Argiope bruennichi]|uniref:Clathrin light chain n=1 Tax=Argiope bruennichi TaxID=94029 RepID=A0A8T0F7A7_ARGBR|nr:clathrin light chain-like isoform X2 [Argiope bruennichi]KAF8787066.1 Clathrin light chain A like protein [Argiope bruennichi]
MSDFEFEGEIVNHIPPEDDPAADFLAREQNQLAGIEDETLGLDSEQNVAAGDFDNDFGLHNSVNTEHMNGPSNEHSPSSTPVRSITREEPQKIKTWREEQQKMLEIKDAEEEKKKQELRESAKKELDDWYTRYREQIEKSKLNNRAAENDMIAERDAEAPGQEWERIARLCDFNPKSSRSTKDTSRMRSIILQLKQQSPVPPRKS